MDCKLIQNGERVVGTCPLCGEKTSHGALNGPRLCHSCDEEIFIYYPGLKDANKCTSTIRKLSLKILLFIE
jgi:hypothetical protein